MINLSEDFWDQRYKHEDTGWDLGEISPPLKAYFDQLTNKELKILIPGGGNSHEAEYLHTHGFLNVYVVDVFDLIIEQTFFCALNPNLRPAYTKKMSDLLYKEGKILGLLFDDLLNTDKPPFGGSKTEYLEYFKPDFTVLLMEHSYNSHPLRTGKELFFKAKLKN